MNEKKTVPSGYMEDAKGALIPTSKVKPVDKDRDSVVRQLCDMAEQVSADLMAFKTTAMNHVNEFIERSLAEYDAKAGGSKGNVTLHTFDGRYRIVRQMQDTITFDERLQAAKALIDECVKTWSKGSNDNIKVLINDAFQVDKQGQINTGRVLRLRSLQITDERWQRAMEAIGDSMRVASTKPYIRFYKRDDTSGHYFPISLDVAAV
ncbi:DUF3164 family protein [Variovorax sp. VNK109]|uniref:DUF3164 family protein n=1 Tax=Variovorax sp. VNK109 TaxID=3400919 RepID=UPI003C08A32D